VRRYLVFAALLLGACSDGATRIAYDIEAGAAAFRGSAATSYSVKHVPEPYPEGCGGPYSVQLSAASILVIWCKDAAGARIVGSHGTTYHLRFVEVPRQLNLEKPAGEPLYIDLEKQANRIVVVDIR
jgi:hypothetical protein